MTTAAALLRTVKDLQERRCAAYAKWHAAFQAALRGGQGASFETTSQEVIAVFGDVSTALRAVQRSAQGTSDPGLAAAARYVDRHIEELQRQEKAKYEATVEAQRIVAAHAREVPRHTDGCCVRTSTAAAPSTAATVVDVSDSVEEPEPCAVATTAVAQLRGRIAAATEAIQDLAEDLQAEWTAATEQ